MRNTSVRVSALHADPRPACLAGHWSAVELHAGIDKRLAAEATACAFSDAGSTACAVSVAGSTACAVSVAGSTASGDVMRRLVPENIKRQACTMMLAAGHTHSIKSHLLGGRQGLHSQDACVGWHSRRPDLGNAVHVLWRVFEHPAQHRASQSGCWLDGGQIYTSASELASERTQ